MHTTPCAQEATARLESFQRELIAGWDLSSFRRDAFNEALSKNKEIMILPADEK